MSSAPRLPYLPLFTADFFAATLTWTGEETSLYLLLLALQWQSGPLPADPARIAQIARYDPQHFARLWKTVGPKFDLDGDRRVNRRLEHHRVRAAAITAQHAEAGRLGAEKRWRGDGAANSAANSAAIGKANGRDDGIQSNLNLKSQSNLRREPPPNPPPSEGGPGRKSRPKNGSDRRERSRASDDAWGNVDLARNKNDFETLLRKDPLAAEAVRMLGGFATMGQCTKKELWQLRARFRDLYEAMLQQT